MSEWFDALSKGLATGQSRRQTLRWLGSGAAGAGLSALVPGHAWAQGNSDCAHFCNSVFSGAAAGQCISDGAQHKGLCYSACGPAGSGGTLCGNRSSYASTVCCATSQCQTCNAYSGTCATPCTDTCCTGNPRSCYEFIAGGVTYGPFCG